MQKITFNRIEHLEKLRLNPTTDFPSPHHELAWAIAIYFGETYSQWVRTVKRSPLLLGQIQKEFDFVKTTNWGRNQKVRILTKNILKN